MQENHQDRELMQQLIPLSERSSSAIQQLEPILNSLSSGAVIFSSTDRLVYANSALLKQFGYSSITDLADNVFGADFPHFFDDQESRINLRDFLASRKSENGEQNPILVHFTPSNSRLLSWISLHQISVPDGKGGIHHTVWIANDLTELRTEQANLRAARDELESKVQERTTELQRLNQELVAQIKERQEFYNQTETLARLSARINIMTDLPGILQKICDETIESTNYTFCSIFLYNEEIDKLELSAYAPYVDLPNPYPTINRQMYEDYLQIYGSPVVIPDINSVSDEPGLGMMRQFGVRTLIFFPILNIDELIGSLGIASVGEVCLPTQNELNFLRHLIAEVKVSISKGHLIDKLKDSNNRMQYLSKKLVEVQEEERRNLARELHDQIGQSLTSLRINLDLISHAIATNPYQSDIIQGYIEKASETTGRLLERVREMSLDLRPTMLDDFGLVPALLSFFARFTAQTNIQVEFKHSGVDGRFSSQLETAAFRIIQEALTNSAKYSGALEVFIRLWADSQYLRLQVEDNGNGFDLKQELNSGRTSGLSGMYERAESLGGSLDIETELSLGTCLTAEFPSNGEKRTR